MSLEQIGMLVAEALKLVLPAYCANAAPVIFGGGAPLDFGKNFWDGRRIFGEHKTFRGFFAGLVIGTLVGVAESLVFEQYPVFSGVILALGALFGDLAGSFLKRRIGLSPGAPLPLVDQLDFVFGALLFAYTFTTPPWSLIATAILLTLPIHFLTNVIAYALGVKDKPW